MLITLLLLIPAAVLFTVINIFAGCYLMVRLGYGPPDWRTALNLVVRLTTLQKWLNAGRDWLGQKMPWADKLLVRLHVPNPVTIIEIVDEHEDEHEREAKPLSASNDSNKSEPPPDDAAESHPDNG